MSHPRAEPKLGKKKKKKKSANLTLYCHNRYLTLHTNMIHHIRCVKMSNHLKARGGAMLFKYVKPVY